MHLNPGFMWHIYLKNHYLIILGMETLQLPQVKSYHFGLKSLRFRVSMLWNNLPFSIKSSETLTEFKNKLNTLGNIHYLRSVSIEMF